MKTKVKHLHAITEQFVEIEVIQKVSKSIFVMCCSPQMILEDVFFLEDPGYL